MSEPKWHVVFHTTDNGKRPAIEFLVSLEPEDQVRIRQKLAVVEQQGPQYDEFSDQLDDDIWELRFHIRDGIVRLFYFYQPNHTIVVTHGMRKKAQKAKRSDIDLARQYMGEYLRRD